MLIEYVTNRSRRHVSDDVGRELVDRKIARAVHEARSIELEAPAEPAVVDISPITGKPKRQYRRRDMQAEGS